MATPVDVVETLARVYVAQETTFASGGTFVSAFPVAETLAIEKTQELLPVRTLAVRPNDTKDNVKSFKGGTAKFDYYMQPADTVLEAGATVPTGASEPPLWVLLKTLMGGQSVAAGSAVVSSADDTHCVVTAATGANFPDGQLVLLEDDTEGLQAAVIQTRATDTLTFWPQVTAGLTAAASVVNLPTWYPATTNDKSLALRLANAQGANYQWSCIGGTGSFELKLERGQLALASFDLAFAQVTGPSALGYSAAHAADTMDTPLNCRNAQVYLQAVGTSTRTEYPVETMALKLNLGNKHIETLSGGTEGLRGVMRSEDLYNPVATLELTFRADHDMDALFDSVEHFHCLIVIPVGTATGRRVIVVDFPRGEMSTVPKFAKGANNLTKCTITLEAQLDQACTATTALATAGVRIACG